MQKVDSTTADNVEAEENKNEANKSSGIQSEQWGAHAGNLEQPERLRTFIAKNKIK